MPLRDFVQASSSKRNDGLYHQYDKDGLAAPPPFAEKRHDIRLFKKLAIKKAVLIATGIVAVITLAIFALSILVAIYRYECEPTASAYYFLSLVDKPSDRRLAILLLSTGTVCLCLLHGATMSLVVYALVAVRTARWLWPQVAFMVLIGGLCFCLLASCATIAATLATVHWLLALAAGCILACCAGYLWIVLRLHRYLRARQIWSEMQMRYEESRRSVKFFGVPNW